MLLILGSTKITRLRSANESLRKRLTDPTLLCQILIPLKVPTTLLHTIQKFRVIGLPVGEMVFRQHGEFRALSGSGADESGSFVEIVLWVKRLDACK
jgi:hypothetical protein